MNTENNTNKGSLHTIYLFYSLTMKNEGFLGEMYVHFEITNYTRVCYLILLYSWHIIFHHYSLFTFSFSRCCCVCVSCCTYNLFYGLQNLYQISKWVYLDGGVFSVFFLILYLQIYSIILPQSRHISEIFVQKHAQSSTRIWISI